MEDADASLGYLVLILGLVCNGSFCVPHKHCSVSTPVFALYFATGSCLVSELTLPIVLLLRRRVIFSWAGIGSGLTQYATIHFVFYTVERAGVALSMVAFAGAVILASKLLEDILVFGIVPADPPLFAMSMGVVVVSLGGVFISRRISDRRPPDLHAAAPTAPAPHIEGANEHSTPSIGQLQDDMPTLGLLVWPAPSPGQGRSGLAQETARDSARLWLQVGGGTSVVTVGLIGVKLWDKLVGPDGPHGIEITWSFGIGLLGSALVLFPIVFAAVHGRTPRRADLGTRRDVLGGLCCGVLAGLANLCMDVAIHQDIPLGTVNVVMQSGIVVAGLWGIRYRELVGGAPIALFFASSLAFLVGVGGLALTGG